MKFRRNSTTRLYRNGSNANIRAALENRYVLKQALHQARKIAHKFDRGNEKSTTKFIWNYLRKEIRYVPDGVQNQNIKLPFRLLKDRTGDCKSYSLFAWAILKALGYDSQYQYTSYNDNPTPSHVYIKTMSGIILDGVYDKYDDEKPYTHKKTKSIIL
jgi:hypothetical protein